jgi:hypothetical protein
MGVETGNDYYKTARCCFGTERPKEDPKTVGPFNSLSAIYKLRQLGFSSLRIVNWDDLGSPV